MHAGTMIHKILDRECTQIHAKRRCLVADTVQAASRGKLTLMGLSRHLPSKKSEAPIRERIKRVDRALGNKNLLRECPMIYQTMVKMVLHGIKHPAIIVDWSPLTQDGGLQLIRASAVVRGRSMTLYEEVHRQCDSGSPEVHKRFLARLETMLPAGCDVVFISDAGFRSPWFQLLDSKGYAWVGRIRNRDMVRSQEDDQASWHGCKELYQSATGTARDLGAYTYVRSNSVSCRLVLIKKPPAGRHQKTVQGKPAHSSHTVQQRKAQTEPWLLAVSPRLAHCSAKQIVKIYSARMQIEQTFRDTKNPRWGLGLSESQSHRAERWSILLMIGALLIFALWLIGLTAKKTGYQIQYGSKKKAATTLSIISLAKWWLEQPPPSELSNVHFLGAIDDLRAMVFVAYS